MIIEPVSVSLVTKAIEKRFAVDPAFGLVTVSRSGEINANPSICPWVGVYRANCLYPIRTLGMGAGFRNQRIGVVLLAQESDPGSGAACEDRLDLLVVKIVTSLLSEPTLGGAVHTIDEFEVRYPDYRRVDDSVYVQTAMIMFTAITTVGGNQ